MRIYFRDGKVFSKETFDRVRDSLRRRRPEGETPEEEKPGKKILKDFAEKTHALKLNFPNMKEVNVIDKYSRVWFPVSFMLFNLVYWSVYSSY